MSIELIGYTDRFSAAAGESVAFKVSTDLSSYEMSIVRLIHGDIKGPGFKTEIITPPQQQNGRKQIAYAGSYVLVNHPMTLDSFTFQTWIYPTTPQKGSAQGLISHWSQDSGCALVIGENGDLGVWLGDGLSAQRFYTGTPLRSHKWYFVAATFDSADHVVRLYQIPLSNYVQEMSSAVVEHTAQVNVVSPQSTPLLIAAASSEIVGSRTVASDLYNGKIDRPRIFSRTLNQDEIERLRQGDTPADVAGNDVLAAWDFSADIAGAAVSDSGRHQLHGVVINMPTRAVTGHNWDSSAHDFKHAPEQYGAIHFHDDDLEDAGWDTDFTWQIPEGTRSGFYAAHLVSGEHQDYIPFFVRPKRGTASARAAVIVPTMTYLAYANERMPAFDSYGALITSHKVVKDPLDLYLAEHPEFAMSIYDLHSDGSGCAYSTRLRPIINMRPNYRMWLVAAPRHLGADLYLVDWLEQKGFDYDVFADEDLHHEGKELLSHYAVVMTGTHPEYWTTPMLTGLEDYLNDGGKLMYLGANGYYWVTAVDSERPHVVEVRRGTGGTRAWNSAPGEHYHSTTGELGGLWRHRGKAPQKIAGVGFTSQGWNAPTPPYVRQSGSYDERAAFIFEGVGDEEAIGNFGLVLGGAAGDEIDRLDFALGSPPHTLLLATASGYNRKYMPVIEDHLELSAMLLPAQDPLVRADMVYFETPNNGAVFSTGAITWCGSLSHNNYDNNVSRITENVLRRFLT
jgi:N,N-dimethylformamidase